MKFPKELITVTPLSKAVAFIMFITIPVIAFFAGVDYQQFIDGSNQQQYISISSSLKLSVSSPSKVVNIKELGITLTVPNSLKDLTYETKTYTNNGSVVKNVVFSTQALTAYDKNCSVSGMSPPLGSLARQDGKYPATPNAASGRLVKQFSTFYISYFHAQSACGDFINMVKTPSHDPSEDFQKTFSTISDLK